MQVVLFSVTVRKWIYMLVHVMLCGQTTSNSTFTVVMHFVALFGNVRVVVIGIVLSTRCHSQL